MRKRILGLVLLLGAAGTGIFLRMSHLSEEPVKVIQSQLEAINSNDISRAYGYFAEQVHSRMSLELFRDMVEHNSRILKSQSASFPFRQIYYRGGTLVFDRNSEQPPEGEFRRLSEDYLKNTLHTRQGYYNVAVIRGSFLSQAGENEKVRYVLMEEPDAVTGEDRWVIYDFALGEW